MFYFFKCHPTGVPSKQHHSFGTKEQSQERHLVQTEDPGEEQTSACGGLPQHSGEMGCEVVQKKKMDTYDLN